MFNSVYTVFIRQKLYGKVVSSNHKPCFLQLSPFSSAAAAATPKSIPGIANRNSFAVNYLINTLGFSPEKAYSASKYLNFESPEKPDSVIASLKKHGFTQEQIGMMARNFPPFILLDSQKVLLPKIEYFQSSGMSEIEITKIFSKRPIMLARSLERQIKPTFNFIKSLFDANETSLSYLKRATEILCCDLQSRLLPNVEVLKEAGVPDSKIVYLLQYYPSVVMKDTERLRKSVEDLKEMSLNPSTVSFIIALHVCLVVGKSNREKKMVIYKKWGVSDDEIISAFGKNHHCMKSSAEKITAVMDLLVNKMGLDSSLIMKAPALVSYSLEKRLKPRSSFYKILVEKGLIKKGSRIVNIFQCTEKDFLKKFVQCYEERAPGLLQLYQKKFSYFKE